MTYQNFLKLHQKKEVEEYPNTVLNDLPNPTVSVWIVTYNQRKYIHQTLDSILAQNVNFSFEIILGDDDSNDGTREICVEYAQKYPAKIRLFLHNRLNAIKISCDTPNPNFQGIYNWYHCRGKYIATLEGDDYWTDPDKLQKQVDYLDTHVKYAGVGTNFSMCDETGALITPAKYVDFVGHDFRLSYINKFHAITRTLNVMYRNYPIVFNEISELAQAPFLDRIIGFIMSKYGPIKILPDNTSMFRKNSGFFSPLRSSIGKIQLEAQWEILLNHFKESEWKYLCLVSLHLVRADLFKKMSFLKKLHYILRNQIGIKSDPYFDSKLFRLCLTCKPEEIPQSWLMISNNTNL